ncbi:MAG: HPF/RaiA family ribosome-associated protein [Oceanococcaceae bacterium]
MNLHMQSRPFSLTAGLRQAVRRALRPVDRRFGESLQSVQVRLDDINGKRGGVDKRCRLVFGLPHVEPVVVEALSDDMYRAIGMASRRAQHALDRRTQRRQSGRRTGDRIRLEP